MRHRHIKAGQQFCWLPGRPYRKSVFIQYCGPKSRKLHCVAPTGVVVNIPTWNYFLIRYRRKLGMPEIYVWLRWNKSKRNNRHVYPVSSDLAWAVTIHKSQGWHSTMWLSISAPGIRKRSGVCCAQPLPLHWQHTIKRPLLEKDVMINPVVTRFYAYLRTKPIEPVQAPRPEFRPLLY